ncbi:hypothetical protein XELAEV_18047263mg [Xenopus laevis]|uniref:Uncharacterized protein n=1 Tax=Xenopus laevis TaxID=8355 RepID=A0A974BUI3_XENLA|nr:hypothetical protein XELAEV_18047263mg [Xenopus laevis]
MKYPMAVSSVALGRVFITSQMLFRYLATKSHPQAFLMDNIHSEFYLYKINQYITKSTTVSMFWTLACHKS